MKKIQECAVALHGTELKRENSAAKDAVKAAGAKHGLAMQIWNVSSLSRLDILTMTLVATAGGQTEALTQGAAVELDIWR